MQVSREEEILIVGNRNGAVYPNGILLELCLIFWNLITYRLPFSKCQLSSPIPVVILCVFGELCTWKALLINKYKLKLGCLKARGLPIHAATELHKNSP